jgi:hypothetical protein
MTDFTFHHTVIVMSRVVTTCVGPINIGVPTLASSASALVQGGCDVWLTRILKGNIQRKSASNKSLRRKVILNAHALKVTYPHVANSQSILHLLCCAGQGFEGPQNPSEKGAVARTVVKGPRRKSRFSVAKDL